MLSLGEVMDVSRIRAVILRRPFSPIRAILLRQSAKDGKLPERWSCGGPKLVEVRVCPEASPQQVQSLLLETKYLIAINETLVIECATQAGQA
jgi:hypothetical protein